MNKLFAFTLEAIIVMVFIGIIASLTIQNLGYNANLKKGIIHIKNLYVNLIDVWFKTRKSYNNYREWVLQDLTNDKYQQKSIMNSAGLP